MTPAEKEYQRAGLRLRVARATLLLDLANKIDDAELPDLLTFAAQLGDLSTADGLGAFRAQQAENLRDAQAELENGNTQATAASVQSRGARPGAKF